MNDAATLERLAGDANDNVREATLMPLKRLKGSEAEPQFVTALSRKDYQLLRTAARELQKMTPSKAAGTALLDALIRITADKKDTSRDARVALLERLREFGHRDMQERLLPLLNDFDPKVAEEAAKTLGELTGGNFSADPRPLPRPPLPLATEILYLQQNQTVLIMADGKRIELTLDPENAPLNSVRFLRLAKAGYFNNLTFHRVVPNFVIQGGSPGANEYMGDGPFVRDEITSRSHTFATLGLSTRGRDTGDAQIFVNLVDNLRLDFGYTVFGTVHPEHLLKIVEGDTIREVRFLAR
jgi:cyclophilin family peptidyl-prolyl cis-trans isomerase